MYLFLLSIFVNFAGWKFGYLVNIYCLYLHDSLLMLHPKPYDEFSQHKMDPSNQQSDILIVYWSSVLSTILHPHTNSNHSGTRSCTSLVSSRNVHYSGKIGILIIEYYSKTQIAHQLGTIEGVDCDPILVNFFGIFFFFLHTCKIIGSIISTTSEN